MTNQRVQSVSDEKFSKAVLSSSNIREILLKLKLHPAGANYKMVKTRCEKLSLPIPSTRTDLARFRATISDNDIINVCASNFSMRSSLSAFDLKDFSSNVKWIKSKIDELSINTSHWRGKGHLKGKTHDWTPKIPLENILVENSDYQSSFRLKKRLLKAGLLDYKCEICSLDSWLDQPISLQLDHINGINNDHRLDNLRLLCPNCHSQTSTFAGKNKSTY